MKKVLIVVLLSFGLGTLLSANAFASLKLARPPSSLCFEWDNGNPSGPRTIALALKKGLNIKFQKPEKMQFYYVQGYHTVDGFFEPITGTALPQDNKVVAIHGFSDHNNVYTFEIFYTLPASKKEMGQASLLWTVNGVQPAGPVTSPDIVEVRCTERGIFN